jgi:hypothetical protein
MVQSSKQGVGEKIMKKVLFVSKCDWNLDEIEKKNYGIRKGGNIE